MISEESPNAAKLKARIQRWQSYVQEPAAAEAEPTSMESESFTTTKIENVLAGEASQDVELPAVLMLTTGGDDAPAANAATHAAPLPHLPPVFTPVFPTPADEDRSTTDYIRDTRIETDGGPTVHVGTVRRLPSNGYAARSHAVGHSDLIGGDFPVNQAAKINDAAMSRGRIAVSIVGILAVCAVLFFYLYNQ